MSTTNAPRRTCPSNATTQPGQIVLDAQVKRHTKVQKNADDLVLKEMKEAKEVQIQKGLECLAGMQNEMEQVQEELLTKKAVPIQPKPRACKATKPVVGNDTDSMMDADEVDSHQEAVKNLDGEAAGVKKKRATKKGGKPLIRDAISNMQSKISSEASSKVEGDNTMTRVSDGKDTSTPHINASTQKFTLGGRQAWKIRANITGIQHFNLSTPTSIFSQGTASTAASSDAQIPIWKPVAPAQIPDAEVLIGSFADDDIDDTLEHDATIVQGKGKSKVASIFDTNLDFNKPIAPVVYESDDDIATSFVEHEPCSQEPRAPFTQVENPLKQKAYVDELSNDNKESMVSDWSMDIEGPDLEDAIVNSDHNDNNAPEPKPVVVKKEKDVELTSIYSDTHTDICICCDCALNMFADNDLKVKQVLASGLRGKLAIKLPKVLNKTTGKMTNVLFLFLGARWTKVTASFIKSISSKPAGLLDDESEDDEHAMLCLLLYLVF
ncbi:hypothetical protein EDB19DRAFT_1833853 [Suillus lakei]|nr:hypothetical protein EDB19DRAFT_1833853 [Suillus lakei]